MNNRPKKIKSILTKGLQWSLFSSVAISILSLFYYAILTRYLSPDEFGVFSLCLIIVGFIEFFSGAGVSAIIIQEKNLNQEQYSTFFWINIILGICFSFLLFLTAPIISNYFNNASLTQAIYILGAIPALNALGLLHNNILRKEIQIDTSEKIEVIGNVIQISAGIFLARNGLTFLSLPVGFLMNKLFSNVAYYLIGHKYFRPSIHFNYKSVQNQLSLGTYQVFEKLFNYIRGNIDKFLIGRFLGIESLGIYSLSLKFIDFPLSKINPGMNKVLFPYFSRIQNRPLIISRLYTNVISVLSICIIPVLFFVVVYANEIVSILFDESYKDTAFIIQILSVLGLLRSVSNIGGNVINAIGKFKFGFYWNLVWASALTTILFFSLQFNINLQEFTLILFLTNLFAFIIWQSVINRFIKFPLIELFIRLFLLSIISYYFILLLKTISQPSLQSISQYFSLFITFLFVLLCNILVLRKYLKVKKLRMWK